jgi:hypothetical protein
MRPLSSHAPIKRRMTIITTTKTTLAVIKPPSYVHDMSPFPPLPWVHLILGASNIVHRFFDSDISLYFWILSGEEAISVGGGLLKRGLLKKSSNRGDETH